MERDTCWGSLGRSKDLGRDPRPEQVKPAPLSPDKEGASERACDELTMILIPHSPFPIPLPFCGRQGTEFRNKVNPGKKGGGNGDFLSFRFISHSCTVLIDNKFNHFPKSSLFHPLLKLVSNLSQSFSLPFPAGEGSDRMALVGAWCLSRVKSPQLLKTHDSV